jgi:hypothetical protein
METKDESSLHAHHAQLVSASGISPEVARARGYRTVVTKSTLTRLGFSEKQALVPALLIPIHGVTGDIVLYQLRPDHPRIVKGKALKYETPARARMVLDVPSGARPHLGDPSRPLFITEGARKADAAVSQGLCCVALLGVWNWRGTNEDGGKGALADWECIALNDREVYIVFDSDVMLKREVHDALVRLKAFLEQRKARVRVIYLPPGPAGEKQGLDDFLATPRPVGDLLSLATTEVRPLAAETHSTGGVPYRATPNGLVWHRPTAEGPVPVPLTNFTARIVGDVSADDGTDEHRSFEIVAAIGDREVRFQVPAAQFASMGWVTAQLGAQALVLPGFQTRDHARVAIQMLSGEVPRRQVFTHTGWRKADDQMVYLHAGGAIGTGGVVPTVEVTLPAPLAGYVLPPPPTGEIRRRCIELSLGLLTVAPPWIAVPLCAAIWRAPLGSTDFTVHLSGPTGAGKSELAALVQQHYGAALDARHLPASWTSTGNALEGLAFHAKDALVVIDDFAPSGSQADVLRYHRDADRVIRAQGNNRGRARMRADASLKGDKAPRGLIVSTGEDIPRGQSVRARTLLLELSPGDLDWTALTDCQTAAAAGIFAWTMSGYLQWVAGRYDLLRKRLVTEVRELRAKATTSRQHRRTPQIMADLGVGLRFFFEYAVEAGALTAEGATEYWELGWEGLGRAGADQVRHQGASEPTRRFLDLLSAALAAGRAHVADRAGVEPPQPSGWGWRPTTSGAGDAMRDDWRPMGQRVGWIDGADLYLEADAAYAAVQQLARDGGDGIAVTVHVLKRRLRERGLLESVDAPRGTLTVRRMLEGRPREVLHLRASVLAATTDDAPLSEPPRSSAATDPQPL